MMVTSTSPTPPAEALRQSLLANREQALTQLYQRAFPQVRRYVGHHGGSAQDAQDVFHDALIVLYEQATSNTLVLTAAPSTYLVGIGRNLWHHEQRRRARLPHEALPDHLDQLLAEPTESDESGLAVLDYVEQLGDKCKRILLAFYYFQQPLGQITATLGYGSVRSATVQKFKCLERLRQSVRAALTSEVLHH